MTPIYVVTRGGSGGGSAGLTPTTVKTAPTTAAGGQLVLTDSSASSVPITLPSATVGGQPIGVKQVIKGTAHVTTIATSGSDVFNVAAGSVLLTLPDLNQSVRLTPGNGIWYVEAADRPNVDGRPSYAIAGAKRYQADRQLYNWTESSTRNLRAAIARMQSGGAPLHVADIGDSTTAGLTTPGSLFYKTAPAGVLRALFDRYMGFSLGPGWMITTDLLSTGSIDPRYSESATLGNSADNWFGASARQFNAAQVVTLSAMQCDTVDVLYHKLTSGNNPGTATLKSDGVTIGTIDGSTPGTVNAQVDSFTIPAGVGSHVITLEGPAGVQTFRLQGLRPRVAAPAGGPSGIYVTKLGLGSQKFSQLNSTPAPMWALLGADAALFNLGINDYAQSIGAATYLSDGRTALQTAQAAGIAPIIRVPTPTAAAGDPAGQPAYHAMLYQLADELDVPLIDPYARWGSVAITDLLGYYFETGGSARTHGSPKGYADVGYCMYSALRTLL